MFKQYWQKKPLLILLVGAFLIRLIAVLFSKGFGMQDDHFLVIEVAQSLVDFSNYNQWLPSATNAAVPSGHSWFYIGLHYIFFIVCKILGILDPQIKMYLVRLIHAIFSLFTVYFGYKITEQIASKKEAIQVGILLAFSWYMPYLSVRNLVEVVCIPFMLGGIWIFVKHNYKPKLSQVFWAGIIVGVGFSVRFQTAFFILGIGLALLIYKKWKDAIVFGFAGCLSIMLIQGVIDLYIWGKPFAEMTEYIHYNIINKYTYFTAPWYTYLLLIGGILIPPISLFLFWGFLRTWKKHIIIFLPTLLFLLFHMYFPNKQERFILPIIPFIILLGIVGWSDFIKHSTFWQKNKLLLKGCWIFFWIINIILLPIISTSYTKRSQIEAMAYLSKYKNISSIIVEDRNHSSVKMIPKFYLNQWPPNYQITEETNFIKLKQSFDYFIENKQPLPQFILFCDSINLKQRVQAVDSVLPTLTYETTIEPSFIDNLMHTLNHHNKNQTIYIYSIK